MKLEDACLEEKVQSTVSIGLTYKSIQKSLNHKPKKNQRFNAEQLLGLDRWGTWRLATVAVEAPFDSAAAVDEFYIYI